LREHRFSDVKAAIPRVSATALTDRLRALENAGLVERHYLPPPSPSKTYRLAEPAHGLRPALDALANWRSTKVRHVPAGPYVERARRGCDPVLLA